LTVLQGFILGIIQGLSEFLPISSSGHLVLFQRLFGLEEGVITFDIAVHIATLIPILFILWKDVVDILRKPFGKLPLLIVVGTIPTLVIGAVFHDFFTSQFESARTLGIEFLFTGLVLWYADSVRTKNKGLDKMTYLDAAVVGTAQGIAILPAVSRSGLTIAGALARGLNREFALKFSFLMSIPAILAAAAKDGYDIISSGNGLQMGVGVGPLIAGIIAAGLSGYFAIKFMLKIFSKVSLKYFSVYVFILGAFVLIEQIFSGKLFGRLF
jgi:undecaprenyl-diphosphatase